MESPAPTIQANKMSSMLGSSVATCAGVKKIPLPTTEATISSDASQSESTLGS
jgi:hypothetical protein